MKVETTKPKKTTKEERDYAAEVKSSWGSKDRDYHKELSRSFR